MAQSLGKPAKSQPYSVTPKERRDHSVVLPGSSVLPTPATHAQTGFKDTAPLPGLIARALGWQPLPGLPPGKCLIWPPD